MIKKIWWLSLGLLAGYGCLSTTTYAAKNEIEVQYIDSKDFSVKEKDNVPENTSVFYINKEFNKNKKNQIRKIDDIEYLENGEKNIVVNEDVEIAATYNFIKDNVRYNGDIYASSEDTYDSIENKIEEIMLQINEGTYFDGHNISSKSRFVGQFYKDANWVCISEKKLILYVHIKMSILVTILNGERHWNFVGQMEMITMLL